jgi:hypothetical protein
MDAEEKTCALEAWNILWDKFIADILGTAVVNAKTNRAECLALWKSKLQQSTNKL